MTKRLKIAIICHFSNPEIRAKLNLSERRIDTFLRQLLSKPPKPYQDFAPWISAQLSILEKQDDTEIHVIAPHNGLRCLIMEFEQNRIHYHFFKPLNKNPLFSYPGRFRLFKMYSLFPNRYLMKRILTRISPDVVNLVGTENPYYSVASLDIKGVPVLVTAQTVYANPLRSKLAGSIDWFRWDLELKIFDKEKYYAAGADMHRELIIGYKPEAIILSVPGSATAAIGNNMKKDYDFVFFSAQVTTKKGIDDALEAFKCVQILRPEVTMNIIGDWDENYKNSLCPGLQVGIMQNGILYSGYYKEHRDLLMQVQKSRFALLPVKLDAVSGTIRESMLIGLPVITYITTGTPALNQDAQNVLLADIGDVKTLTHHMIQLLDDRDFASQMSNRAKEYAEREFSYEKNTMQWLLAIKAIVGHYYFAKPIPEMLLYRSVNSRVENDG